MMRSLVAAAATHLARRAQQHCRDALIDGLHITQELSSVQGPGIRHLTTCRNPGSLSMRGFATRLYASAAQPATVPLQAATTSQSAQPGDLVIHPSAVQRLKELQAHQGQHVVLRIEVEGGGCSGFQYKFSLDTSSPSNSDKVFEVEGARVVCDPDSFEMLRGSQIEFEDTLMRRAFVVGSNPNSEASCGCGSSFAAKMPAITRPGAQTKAVS